MVNRHLTSTIIEIIWVIISSVRVERYYLISDGFFSSIAFGEVFDGGDSKLLFHYYFIIVVVIA